MLTNRIPATPPQIKPVAETGDRPLWSVMIPTYNCSNYLKETLESVLSQDKGRENMQIEVVDDCSTDYNVLELVTQIGQGRISFFRQEQNVGSLRNFETCINRSRGRLIHLLHGDDLVKPGFYVEIENLFKTFPSAGAAFTGFSGIDEKGNELYFNDLLRDDPGIIDDWLKKISQNQRLQACAMVVKREVYEKTGGFFGVEYGEDWEMWARIGANFPVAYSPETLASYRHHSNNISSRFLSTCQNIKDIKKVIETIQNYLPADIRAESKRISTKHFAVYFTKNAQKIYRKKGDAKLALKQAHAALMLQANKRTIISLITLYIKIIVGYRGNKYNF